jgi:hypothetical protein
MADDDSRTEGDRFSPVNAVVHESIEPQAAYDRYSRATSGHDRREEKR